MLAIWTIDCFIIGCFIIVFIFNQVLMIEILSNRETQNLVNDKRNHKRICTVTLQVITTAVSREQVNDN